MQYVNDNGLQTLKENYMEHLQKGHHHSGHKHGAMIQKLLDCATACENCAASCLDEADVTAMAHCIEIDRDCAELCYLAAKLLTRDSEYAHELLALCEKICRHCAEECAKHKHQHCIICGEKCTQCADACHDHHGRFN